MTPIFLQDWVRMLVVLHALSAMVLLGSCTHAAVVTIGALRGRPRLRLARVYAVVVAASYATTMSLGALAYPTYRYYVRALYFDRYAPWASNLFDIKENFAALGLPLVVGALLLRLRCDTDRDDAVRIPYAVMVLAAAAIVWFDALSGIIITLERGV